MIVVVAGTRHASKTVTDTLHTTLDELHETWGITDVFAGGAYGADRVAERWAERNSVRLHVFRADWGRYGKAAGPRRNQEMLAAAAEYATDQNAPLIVAAFPSGESRGTRHTIGVATKLGMHVIVTEIDTGDRTVVNDPNQPTQETLL